MSIPKPPLLVDTLVISRDGAEHVVYAFRPSTAQVSLPGPAIVGYFQNTGAGLDWRSFSRNPRFVELFARYMKGELPIRPDILDKAKVEPGEYVYVIDRRCATPQGDVPFHDIIGWYKSDAQGRPVPESFEYNADHKIALDDGAPSSILSDSKVQSLVYLESGKWKLRGYVAFARERYPLAGEFDTESDAMTAARMRLDELEREQPSASSGGQDGIQDHVYVIRPDGTEFRVRNY